MATGLGSCRRPVPCSPHFRNLQTSFVSPSRQPTVSLTGKARMGRILRIKVSSNDGNSYLDMWRTAVERERKNAEFEKMADKFTATEDGDGDGDGDGDEKVELEKKSENFKKILEVPKQERDRVQRMQVIDRAAAAIAAAQAVLEEGRAEASPISGKRSDVSESRQGGAGKQTSSIFVTKSEPSGNGVPGPDFWSWNPPSDTDTNLTSSSNLQKTVYPTLSNPVAVKERSVDFLSVPFESEVLKTSESPPIPPMQSQMEIEETEAKVPIPEMPSRKEQESERGVLFSVNAAEVAYALSENNVDEPSDSGVNPDGSRWWKETGLEQRADGVVCRWTMTRGVSADQVVEWQEKFWEAADEFGYKELGSEKSGRDATGNVWREFWRESMWQNSGLMHLEKTADKWGKNGTGDEWQEKWWEHYDASGQAEKWAHKWCSIDPTTVLDAGHAHIWHERWGEKYDGRGGSTKYTDKWAERCEGDGWAKWGDKWDENFDLNGHGVKQGESWWEGKHGDRWNRTWGEHHNGSGWVHKYGKSSSGEHWDTHVEQETWYEKFPHYGFYHCFDNSVQLREVEKPSTSLEP